MGTTTVDISNSFKITEKCLLQEDWDVVTLEDVCAKAINGGTPSTEVEKYWEGDIPWITGADILNQKVSKIRRYITEEAVRNSSTNVIPKGNLLVVTRTGVGKLAIAPFDVAVSQDFTGIIPNGKIKTEFLFWLLNNSANYFLDLTQGTSINGITRKDLMGFVSPIPPLPEQHHIAKILSTVDRAIEQTEAIIAKQQRIKTGLMQDLLTRGIDEHGNLRSEEAHEFKDSPLGRIPVEWDVKQLSATVDLKVGYAFKSSWFSDDGIRLLRGENVGVGIPDWKDTQCLPLAIVHKYEDYKLNAGDLIIGMDRTFTKQGFKVSLLGEEDAPCLLVQRVGCFVPISIPRGFMQLLIQSPTYQRELLIQQKGMDIPHLSKSEILAPFVPIPVEVDEMNTISNRIDSLRLAERNNTHRLNKLRALKTALMQDLLTGKKRVTALLTRVNENDNRNGVE